MCSDLVVLARQITVVHRYRYVREVSNTRHLSSAYMSLRAVTKIGFDGRAGGSYQGASKHLHDVSSQ